MSTPRPVTQGTRLENMATFLRRAPAGPVVEVGVFEGGSLAWLAQKFPQRSFIGYDTFEGMPDACQFDNFHRGGDFMASYDQVRQTLIRFENVQIVKGKYPEADTILPDGIALAHVDVDIYQSTLRAFEHLRERMAPGGRVYCDDAFQPTCDGATLAVCEFAAKYQRVARLDAFGHVYFQF